MSHIGQAPNPKLQHPSLFKAKVPTPNIQAPMKFQSPKLQIKSRRCAFLEVEVLSFFGAWSLEFGAFFYNRRHRLQQLIRPAFAKATARQAG
jgi:hypothetical protein